MSTSVKNSIVVEAPIARAFKVFTEDFGKFNPLSTTCSLFRSRRPSSSRR